MSIIIEKEFKNDDITLQFSSCCGASDKGTEFGIVCRSCWNPIHDYWTMKDADEFTKLFDSEHTYMKWQEFIEQPKFDTYNEWHDWRIELLYGKEVA
jgi:hypothetical protein